MPILHGLSDFQLRSKAMSMEQTVYSFNSVGTISHAYHLFPNHTLVYLYGGRLFMRNQCGETLTIEQDGSAFIGRDSYTYLYAEPEQHEPCRVLFFLFAA